MDPSQILGHVQMDGWFVVKGVIPTDEIETVRIEAETVTAVQGASKTYQGVHSARGILDHIPTFLPHLSDDRILGVATKWFGPHVRISYTNTLISNPGNQRGGWHADWPFNQEKAGHIPAPYADAPVQLSTLWMLSDFSRENGGTLIVPGSHRTNNNPTGNMGVDRFREYPTEMHIIGPAGSVLVFDSRLWHTTACNTSDAPRVGMVVRYAPWWLNLDVLMPGSQERQRIVDEPGLVDNEVPAVPGDVFKQLHDNVQPLYRHWVR